MLADVVNERHVRCGFGTGPAQGLLVKLVFEVIDTQGTELCPAKIEELVPSRWPLALQEVHLVIAIQMVLIGPVAQLHSLEQLVCDVGIASGGHEGWEPV